MNLPAVQWYANKHCVELVTKTHELSVHFLEVYFSMKFILTVLDYFL